MATGRNAVIAPTDAPELFRCVQGAYLPSDICANRHRHNPESVAANPAKDKKARQRAAVLAAITRRGIIGATCDELAVVLGTNPNSISGRITELRRLLAIKKNGTRPTRTGASAGVWVATGCR